MCGFATALPRRVAAGATLTVLLLTAPASANLGPPWRGGDLAAEPTGLENVAITHETLTIDLRPLAAARPGHVEAVYHLDNRGPARKVELLFAAGQAHLSDLEVRLGDQRVGSRPADLSRVPKAWSTPGETPGIHDNASLRFQTRVAAQAFTVTLPAGRHELTVRYQAEASQRYESGQPTIYWQFAYVLAPARAWAGFGGLDVTIYLPEGWLAASAPAIPRDGDVLRASFWVLPADAVMLTAQAPVGPAYPALLHGSRALLVLAAVAGAVLCWRVGRGRGRRGQRAWSAAIGLALVWGLLVLGAGVFAVLGPSLAIPAFQENRWGYGSVLALVGVGLLSLVVLPIGLTIGLVSAAVGARAPAAEAKHVTQPG